MGTLRAAVIGVGRIGSLHARIYAEHWATELVAVMDADSSRARAVGEQLGVPWYTNVEELLRLESVDLVSIATPEQGRRELAVACARERKHLLLEKPLAPTPQEARELVDAVAATGVKAMVNFTLRSDPRYVEAKRLLDSGEVGQPVSFSVRRRGSRMGVDVLAPWTDLLISTAIHDIDQMIWMNGYPVERVFAESVALRSAKWGKEDAILGVLRFANGAIGAVETSWVIPPTMPAGLDASFHVVATGGCIVIEGANHGLAVADGKRYWHPDLTHWPILLGKAAGDLRNSVDNFIQWVLRGTPPAITLSEALYAEQVVAAFKESMRTGQPVYLSDDKLMPAGPV